ncbi:MAG: glycosyltransferase family 1 protein, partial [Actinomycetota bacterium]
MTPFTRGGVVGVNLLWLVPGVVGGSEEYTLRLLRALGDLEPDDLRLRIYGSVALLAAHPDLGERFEYCAAPDLGGAKGARIALEHAWLPAVSRHDDVVHHGGGVVPLTRTQPALVTIHDLQPLDLPEHFSTLKRRWLGAMLPRAVTAARLVLCPSRFTADRIRDRFGVSERRLAGVPQGMIEPETGAGSEGGADAVAPTGVEAGTGLADAAASYGRFLLFPAIAYAHKRHADLIEALAVLRRRHHEISLVLTGGPGPEDAAIDGRVRRLGLEPVVHRLGRVPEDELDALYRSAAALVFPSAYEGFGNPVLEAMIRGCPVVASDG